LRTVDTHGGARDTRAESVIKQPHQTKVTLRMNSMNVPLFR
jgi:hypothetical protein